MSKVVKAEKARKLFPLSSYKKQIENASTVSMLSRIYIVIKIAAAGVKQFDFETDYAFYEAYVGGDLKAARKATSKRLSAALKAGAVNLQGKRWELATEAHNKAAKRYTERHPELDYPRHLVKIENNVAFFSSKKKSKVKS